VGVLSCLQHKSMDKATLCYEVPYPERFFSADARNLLEGATLSDVGRCSLLSPHSTLIVVLLSMLSSAVFRLLLYAGLLHRTPQRRLGARGAADIKAHPFFRGIDWGMLETGQVRSSCPAFGPLCW
jgi:hypothetical protein